MLNRATRFYLAAFILAALLLSCINSIALQTQVPEYYKDALNIMLGSPMGIPLIGFMIVAAGGCFFILFNAAHIRQIVIAYAIGMVLFFGAFTLFMNSVATEQTEFSASVVAKQERPTSIENEQVLPLWTETKPEQLQQQIRQSIHISPWVIAAILATLLGLIVAPTLRKRRSRRDIGAPVAPVPVLASLAKAQAETMQTNQAAGKEQIIECYQQLLTLLAEQYQLVRQPTQTAHEFYQLLCQGNLPAKPLYQITLLFEKACYSQAPFDQQDLSLAIGYLNQIAEAKA
ncbi:DUF4129 domain-containing protein [Motilimonas sp. 1_MG-2023]|uniref:DUF4129 domain-containing protein n=1 Tax=Motilimonas sp. 1_MG-2023 TaxID=3062672 RepID=UPI0026E3BA9B|nr:DUF4129 domain-containing protein [Motilimonas sp. 1_MG-2023]MDO6526618.1 DUF4129 domain-containing protein [Motilimonas sp. 1_MG-2023]